MSCQRQQLPYPANTRLDVLDLHVVELLGVETLALLRVRPHAAENVATVDGVASSIVAVVLGVVGGRVLDQQLHEDGFPIEPTDSVVETERKVAGFEDLMAMHVVRLLVVGVDDATSRLVERETDVEIAVAAVDDLRRTMGMGGNAGLVCA